MTIASGMLIRVVPLTLSVLKELLGENGVVEGSLERWEIPNLSGSVTELSGFSLSERLQSAQNPFYQTVFVHPQLFGSLIRNSMFQWTLRLTLVDGKIHTEVVEAYGDRRTFPQVEPLPETETAWTPQPPIRDPEFITRVVQDGKAYAKAAGIEAFPFNFMIELAPGLVLVTDQRDHMDDVRIYFARRHLPSGASSLGVEDVDTETAFIRHKVRYVDVCCDPHAVHAQIIKHLGLNNLPCAPVYEVWQRRADLSL